MRRESALDSSYYLLENLAGVVFGQLAAVNDEIKKLSIRTISAGKGLDPKPKPKTLLN
jgi:hypothetical protein